MIKYSHIEHRDGFAELRLTCTDLAGGDLRPIIWKQLYGSINRMLLEASVDILDQCECHIEMSELYPSLPRALERIAEAVHCDDPRYWD
jgi:hypothetical protein